MGKEKEKEFQVNWAGGISAWLGAGARRRGQMGPYGPRGAGDGTADAVGAGPRSREGEERQRQGGRRRAVRGGGEPVAGEPDGGSSPVVRFWVDGVVAKHERG
jgi:hypothetical protein